ncbi:hypothetical protein [Luteitalea sp.]|uniref:hypothetical protein n=1 Tax=Luteitalea sp. TaxID=2004800 RepID=UPI0025B7BE13|nr:hypothetical protein [Luteitalea sp.]
MFTPPNAAPSMSVTTASIKVLPAPTSPVRIEPVSIASTEPWALTVRATNTTGESVLGFKLVAFVVTAEGFGRGYQTAPTWRTLAAGASVVSLIQLKDLRVGPTDHVVIGLQSAGSGSKTVSAEVPDMLSRARLIAKGEPDPGAATSSAGFATFGDCDAGFCAQERTACMAACNSQGCPMQSYSCNRTECSFTCTCGVKCV